MIAELRARHRRIVGWGSPLLIAGLLVAYSLRPGEPVGAIPAPLQNDAPPPGGAWFTSSSLFGDQPVEIELWGSPGSARVVLRAPQLLAPDLLVYWRSADASGEDLDGARLLGRMAPEIRRAFALPVDWRGGGQLLLFSLGHMEVVARSAALPEIPASDLRGER